jgi:hypothetical protein
MKRKIIIFNAVLFAFLFGLISLNKKFIRPSFRNTPFVGALAGCFPNFLAALIISLAPMFAVLTRKPKHGRLIVYLVSVFVFAGLTLEELVPMWGASTHYDPLDILASGIGSLLAIVTFELVTLRRKNRQ